MPHHIQISKLFLSLSLSLIMFKGLVAAPAGAATINISNLPLGKVIAINGQKFTKVKNDPNKGPQFLALQRVCYAGMFDGYDMQEFTPADCNCLPTPPATNYTLAGTLTDPRDGKSYEVRKFADGKCWMVDNLMYGGGTDGSADYCVGKTTMRSALSKESTSAIATNGLNPLDESRTTLTGDCLDPRAACVSGEPVDFPGDGLLVRENECICTPGSTHCGYLYNAPAVIQDTRVFVGANYQPTQPTQGICPAGWHIPTLEPISVGTAGVNQGVATEANGDFADLYRANLGYHLEQGFACEFGETGCNFWLLGGGFETQLVGMYVPGELLMQQGISDHYPDGFLHMQGYAGNVAASGNDASGNMALFAVHSSLDLGMAGMGVMPDAQARGMSVRCIKDTTERTMQSFTTTDCDSYPTPAGTDYTPVGTLKDERDGKWYEIRKFADGKCWMVDNLAYGGAVDECANKTTFDDAGSATPTDTFGVGTYGDCRNNPGSSTYGYLYNWQAAMQHASAYYQNTYTGPTTNVQGICPQGWHIPSGNTTGEYQALHAAAGSPTIGFWQPGGNWKGVLSGYYSHGGLGGQGFDGNYWSSTQTNVHEAAGLVFDSNNVTPSFGFGAKFFGITVRCIKN